MGKPSPIDGKHAHAVEKTGNAKTGPVAVTYVGKGSCPPDCLHLQAGTCYGANGSPVDWTWRRLVEVATAREYARAHAHEIDSLPADRPLRMRVVGDVTGPDAARIEARAAARYQARAADGVDARVWSYSHAWRKIDPRSYYDRGVSVLASVETDAETRAALRAGWAVARTVATHPEGGKAETIGRGPRAYRLLPCPAQTRASVTCVDCMLCARADYLRRTRTVITFAAHGTRTRKLRETLEGLDNG